MAFIPSSSEEEDEEEEEDTVDELQSIGKVSGFRWRFVVASSVDPRFQPYSFLIDICLFVRLDLVISLWEPQQV